MIEAIRTNRVPNLVLLHYTADWCVKNLVVVPRFFFTESVIEARPPLTQSARRAGWIGCNILLREIPPDGRITVVKDGALRERSDVRKEFGRLRGLSKLQPEYRGWTLDVLRCLRKLRHRRFTLQEVYAYAAELSELHPNNRNVKPKIRQQLQVLRDLGVLRFLQPGTYELP